MNRAVREKLEKAGKLKNYGGKPSAATAPAKPAKPAPVPKPVPAPPGTTTTRP